METLALDNQMDAFFHHGFWQPMDTLRDKVPWKTCGTAARRRGRSGHEAVVLARKRVFLTGHTGFKGSWLSLWLQQLGAHVTGFALRAKQAQPV
jgi:hypothetical protein